MIRKLLILSAFGFVFLAASRAEAAITFSASSTSGVKANVSSYTFTATVTSTCANAILVVGVQSRDGSSNAHFVVNSMTFASTSMTRQRFDMVRSGATDIRSENWYLVAPTSTPTSTVAITFAGAVDHSSAVGSVFCGVDQARPFVGSAGASSLAPSRQLAQSYQTTVDGESTIDSTYSTAGDFTATSSVTLIAKQDVNGGGDISGAAYRLNVTPTSSIIDGYDWSGTTDTGILTISSMRPDATYATGTDIDSIASGRQSSGGNQQITLTVSSTLTNRIIVLLTTVHDSNHANYPITGASVGTTTMTKVRSDEGAGNVRTEIWYATSTPAGSVTVSATTTGAVGEFTMTAYSLFNVSPTSTLDASAGASSTTGGPSVSLTTASSSAFIVSVSASESNFSTCKDNSWWNNQKDQGFENEQSCTQTLVTAGAKTITYNTTGGAAWAISAASFKPVIPAAAAQAAAAVVRRRSPPPIINQ